MKKRKDDVVSSIRKSLEGLLKSHGVDIIKGCAKFTSNQSLKILESDSFSEIFADKIIIASGSTTLDFANFSCNHQNILKFYLKLWINILFLTQFILIQVL